MLNNPYINSNKVIYNNVIYSFLPLNEYHLCSCGVEMQGIHTAVMTS